MSRQVVAVSKSTSVGSARKLMERARVSVLPVLEGDRLVGVITSGEIEEEDAEKKVGSVNHRLLYVESEDSPEKAAKIMVENRINRLPVVSSAFEMRCIGIITSTEVAKRHKKSLL